MPKTKQYNKIQLGAYAISVRTVSITLVAIVIFFALMHVYFLISITSNIGMRKSVQSEYRELQSELAELEGDYLSMRSSLTLQEATERGFVESNKKTFVYRYKTSDSLALGLE